MQLEQTLGNELVMKNENNKYSIFAEQYLEKPVDIGTKYLGFSVTICTWRGIPTIDDW